ncbi:MAG TPA: RNA methyltransferase [Polyangiaceae bacterium]
MRPERRRSSPEPSVRAEGRLVVGLQPVREAVRRHGARLRQVLIEDRPTQALDALGRFATDNQVGSVRRVSRGELDRLSRGVAHQGAAAFAPDLELLPVEALFDDKELVALALDSLTDPQNFGAVVRSAVAFGGAALVWGEHASAPLTTATFRASAGAIEHARLCRVRSLVEALTLAGERGVHVVGLDPEASSPLASLELDGPTLLVLGSEGEGLGRATRRACRTLASLGTISGVQSVNVSVAAGIALYEIRNQRLKSKT